MILPKQSNGDQTNTEANGLEMTTIRRSDSSRKHRSSSIDAVLNNDSTDLEADDVVKRLPVGWGALSPFLASTTKAFLGSNYLGISFAFSQSGYILGVVGLTVITITTAHCCFMLVECKHIVQQEHRKVLVAAGEATGEDLIQYGTIAQHVWGKWGRILVDICLIITQAGFCVGYLIFLSDTIVHLVANVTPLDASAANMVHTVGMWATVTGVMCISMFRDVASLGWTSIIASVAIVGSALVVMAKTSLEWEGVAETSEAGEGAVPFKWDTLPVFFGIVVSAFEGIGCLLPIDNAMSGELAGSFPRVLNAVMTVVPAFLGLFGLMHYLALGSNTPQIILHNLPIDSYIGIAVRVTLYLAILFGVPLQLSPVFQVLEKALGIKYGTAEASQAAEYLAVSISEHLDLLYDNDDAIQDDNGNDIIDIDLDAAPMDSPIQPSETEGSPSSRAPKRTRRLNRARVSSLNERRTSPASSCDSCLGPTLQAFALRFSVVVSFAVIATIARDFFSFIGAVVGATGGVTMSYILPALFDNRLRAGRIGWRVKMKNYLLVMFGALGGGVSLWVSLQEVWRISSTTIPSAMNTTMSRST